MAAKSFGLPTFAKIVARAFPVSNPLYKSNKLYHLKSFSPLPLTVPLSSSGTRNLP